MATPATLPIIDVTVEVYISPLAPPLPLFNQGLIVGPSNVIPPWGNSLKLLKVNATNEGTGYAVGDIISITQSGASGGQAIVQAIGASGAITKLGIYMAGTGYAIAAGLATTAVTGSGSNAEVDVINVGSGSARLRQYTSTAAILSDGFTLTEPEYIAASLYFDQDADGPAPQYVWIGTQDTGGGAIATAPVTTPGTGYAVGDLLGVVGGNAGLLEVLTVGGGGAVLTVAILQNGSAYTAGASTTTTNGAGTGCVVTITVGSESLLQAVGYCRAASSTWYGFYSCGAQKSDHEALAGWAQNNTPSMYFYNTADSDALNNNSGNIFAYLKSLSYNRAIGLYSTTQGGIYPNNSYSGAAVMGVAFGLNTGLANSYYTLKFKELVGVDVEPLTLTQVNNIQGNNGNIFLNFANAYSYITQGTLANGQFFDEVLQLDMLSADIQYSEMNLLTQNNSIPQTDPGEALLIHAVNGAAQRAVIRGYIGPGQVWQGVTIINLQPGNPLPAGYLAQAYPYSQQSTSDRQARKAQPIYLAIAEAGAVHSLVVGVYVQR